MNKLTKRILFSLIGIIVLFLILKFTGIIGGSSAIKVETDEVKKRTITERVSASGKLKPTMEVIISPDVSGEITYLPVKEGKKVKKGELLCKIRPDIYEAALERAIAALNNSQAQLENAKAQLTQAKAQLLNLELNYKRNKELFEKEAISKSQFEQVETDYKVQQSRVEAAEQSVNAARFTVKSSNANVKEARDNLERTVIRAPKEGTISQLNVEEGERVVGTNQMAGTEIMKVANLSEMEVEVEVNENDIIRINLNDTALIEVDAFIDRKFKGIVTEIANSAKSASEGSISSSDQSTNFIVIVKVLKSSYRDLIDSSRLVATPFRPGMSAIVEIITEKKSNTLSLPILAVTTRNSEEDERDELEEVIFVLNENNSLDKRKVMTGIQDDYYIEIQEGVKEGERVVSGPYSAVSKELKGGMEVEVISSERNSNE